MTPGQVEKAPVTPKQDRSRRASRGSMDDGEKFNAVTHIVGAVLALAGAVVLVVIAAIGGDPWKVVGVAIYGTTLVSLYSFSGALPQPARATEARAAEAGPPEHLSAHRGQLHTLLPGDAAWPVGLVAARDRLGARGARRHARVPAEERTAHPVGGDLRCDGLGGHRRWYRYSRHWARPASRGSPPAACSTPSASSSLRSTRGLPTRTASGTCSCSPAARATTSRSCVTCCDRRGRRAFRRSTPGSSPASRVRTWC